MFLKPSLFACTFAVLALQSSAVVASEDEGRSFDKAYFDQFSSQNALEMLERLPGFSLQDAGEARGLGQGGTNVLVNGQPVTGKGETARSRISQIAAANVIRIEILDAGLLDIPGFSGLVANIVTRRSSVAGTALWEPSFRQNTGPAYGKGNLSISGSAGEIDFSAALSMDMVRVVFEGPETLADGTGRIFETRDEQFFIRGDQPELAAGIVWKRPGGQVLNAKASIRRLDVRRGQASASTAITSSGSNQSSIARTSAVTDNMRFDADYSFPAFGGTLKAIGFARLRSNDATTRFTLFDVPGNPVADRAFEEESTSKEWVARFEQQWRESNGKSWQLAGEGAYNSLDLKTSLLAFNPTRSSQVLSETHSRTMIEELRGEITVAHQRRLNSKSSLQISLGGEVSEIGQTGFKRAFFRPKGFATYTLQPGSDWTFSARVAREVGQINFRDFASTVSLIEGISTQENLELVPQQSWAITGRAERIFKAGHTFSSAVTREHISDLVDRIPLGTDGDAVGNIPTASRTAIETSVTLIGSTVGLPGAQLDLNGSWQWSSVTDPIGGFDRDIGNLRIRDLRMRFRHDLPRSDWSYGFELREIKLAPVFRATLTEFRNVPGGALSPGTNAVFIENKDLFGLRARIEVSEFLGQKSRFRRLIHSGRRDLTAIVRTEDRERSLGGPVISLSLGRTF